jgi:hypothetical protein
MKVAYVAAHSIVGISAFDVGGGSGLLLCIVGTDSPRHYGRQVKRRIGPAWLERDPDNGGWRGRRGRVPDGSYSERAAIVAAARIAGEYVAEAADRDRIGQDLWANAIEAAGRQTGFQLKFGEGPEKERAAFAAAATLIAGIEEGKFSAAELVTAGAIGAAIIGLSKRRERETK